MESTVRINSEAIRQFRGQINESIENLQTQLRKTENAIEAVSESWRDEQFKEFETNFETDKAQIQPLCDVLRKYEGDILANLQAKVENYSNTTMRL